MSPGSCWCLGTSDTLSRCASDLPLVEPQGDDWIVHGRGERTLIWSRPSAAVTPASVLINERTAEGKARKAAMSEAGLDRFSFELPPSSSSSAIDLTGGDDWLGPLTVTRVDRPSLAETRVRVKEPGATYTGFRTVDDARQHLLFLPDTEIELTLVGTEAISESQVKIQAGKTLTLARGNDRSFTTNWKLTEATTLEILLKSARTAAFFEANVPLDRAAQGPCAAGDVPGPGDGRPCDADCDHSAFDQCDRRFWSGSTSLAG